MKDITNNAKRGFTLIELLVVIGIIGLLSVVATVGSGAARQSARNTRRLADARQFQTALELYYNQVSPAAYPIADPTSTLGTGDMSCLDTLGFQSEAGCGGSGASLIMQSVPSDPGDNAYEYYSELGITFAIQIELEGSRQGYSGTILVTPEGIQDI